MEKFLMQSSLKFKGFKTKIFIIYGKHNLILLRIKIKIFKKIMSQKFYIYGMALIKIILKKFISMKDLI